LRKLDRDTLNGYVCAVKIVIWMLLAALAISQSAAQTNLPVPPQSMVTNTVPPPPLPGINIPPAPLVPRPLDPYLLPMTNRTPRPKAIPPPSMPVSGGELIRQQMRLQPPPPTAASLAATQAVTYVEPRLPAPPPAVSNRVFHVAMNGDDKNDGSQESPWRTLQKAANTAEAGDTVLVAKGAYDGFQTKHSGKPGRPITFKADGKVIIVSNNNNPPDHILVRGTDWIVIEGFTLRYAPRAGIGVLDSSDVIIRDNVCVSNQVWGIFSGFAPRIQVLNNKAFGSKEQHGIYISNSRDPSDNPVLRGNECFENAASGIQLNGDCNMGGDGIINGALLENNIVRDNDSKGMSLISIEGSLIRNNLIYNNGRVSGAGGIHLTDQLGCGNPSRRNTIVNNTILEPRIVPIRLSDGARDNILFNNLLIGPHGIVDEVGDNAIDTESNLHTDKPSDVFIAADTLDFHLQINGPACYRGRTAYSEHQAPTRDFEGRPRPPTAPSIGAYDVELPPPATKP